MLFKWSCLVSYKPVHPCAHPVSGDLRSASFLGGLSLGRFLCASDSNPSSLWRPVAASPQALLKHGLCFFIYCGYHVTVSGSDGCIFRIGPSVLFIY